MSSVIYLKTRWVVYLAWCVDLISIIISIHSVIRDHSDKIIALFLRSYWPRPDALDSPSLSIGPSATKSRGLLSTELQKITLIPALKWNTGCHNMTENSYVGVLMTKNYVWRQPEQRTVMLHKNPNRSLRLMIFSHLLVMRETCLVFFITTHIGIERVH